MLIAHRVIDRIARNALQAFGAPGLSVALAAGSDVTCRAYGVADLSTGEAVTPETAFTLASATKSFTALALSILREEGALDWDDPVSGLARDLCAGRREGAAPLTVRDLLSHQTGFGWHDPLWYNSPWSRAAVIRKAWKTGPDQPPRSGFQYCNVTYMLAGEIVSRVSGKSYEEFVRSRILGPLGLRSAHFSGEEALRRGALARPHVRVNGSVRPIEWPDVSKANAACGLRINAPDLAAWMSQFFQPRATGIPVRAFEGITAPQVTIGPGAGDRFYTLFGQPDWLEYGFGWFLRRYRGHRVIFHTGRLPGAASHVAVLPDLGFGIAAMTNLTLACLAETVTLTVLDRMLGGPETDWLGYYTGVSKELERAAAPPVVADGPESASAIADAVRCVGDYTAGAYGRIRVRESGGGLRFAWARYRGDLMPMGGMRFSLRNLGCALLPEGELVEFQEGGAVVSFLGRRFERVVRAEDGEERGSGAGDRMWVRSRLRAGRGGGDLVRGRAVRAGGLSAER